MSRLYKIWTPHTVEVEPYLGEGANGDVHGPKETVSDVYTKDISEVVTDDNGAEAVSRATVRFNLDDTPAKGSYVTIWPGTKRAYRAKVFKVSHHDHPDWPSLGTVWLR